MKTFISSQRPEKENAKNFVGFLRVSVTLW